MNNNTIESDKQGWKVTLVGALANGFLIILKLLSGIFGNSQALIVDAVHSVSDLFTDAVVLFGLKSSRKPPDEEHHFGHGRLETLAAATVGLILIVTALYLGIKALLNIYHQTEYHPSALALVGAFVSIAIKEILYRYTLRVGRRTKSQLLIANAWHHRSDALSSVAVLLGVLGTLINPKWYILDSFAALLVSFFIIKVGLSVLGSTIRELSDAAPHPEIQNRIKQCALGVTGVIDTHDLRVRTSRGLLQVEIHIVVDGCLSVIEGHKIAKIVERCLSEEVEALDRIIIHVDPLEYWKNKGTKTY